MTSILADARTANSSQCVEDWLCGLISEKSPHSILVTLQANLGWGPGNSERVWRRFRELLYLLDRNYREIKRPELLPAKYRFQGIAIMEKAEDNPYIHFIVFCDNILDQRFKYMFLLERLNNTWKLDEQKYYYEIMKKWNERAGVRTKSTEYSLWTDKFIEGTADVRLIRDIPGAVKYLTEEIRGRRISKNSNVRAINFNNFDNIQFIHYQEPDPKSRARNYIYDPANPKRIILNLDNLTWRNKYHRIR